jgi:hypothetical protein
MAKKVTRPSGVANKEEDLAYLKDQLPPSGEDEVVKKLATHISKVWVKLHDDFKPVRRKMIDQMRRVRREYEPNKLTAIRNFMGSEIYGGFGENKARAASSWIEDIYRGDTDLPWGIDPTEIPELPEENLAKFQEETKRETAMFAQELQAEYGAVDPEALAEFAEEYYEKLLDSEVKDFEKKAKRRCDRVAKEIRDKNQEVNWDKHFKDFLYWFTRVSFSCIKGPIKTKDTRNKWEATEEGSVRLVPKEVIVNDVYCPSPFMLFPAIGMSDINNGDIIEVHEFSLQDLADLVGVPGYSDKELKAVIGRVQSKKLNGKWFKIEDEEMVMEVTRDKTLHQKSKPDTDVADSGEFPYIRAQEFWGTVPGAYLKEWGVTEELEPERQYNVNCILIDKHVIKAVITPDNLGRKPYHFSSWSKNPSWIVGEGLLEFAGAIEDAMNAILRALINNIAIASGPMAEVDSDRVDSDSPIYPWRQIRSTSMQMKSQGPAVVYYQAQMYANELVNAFKFFSQILDELTVPAYAQGASQSGVTTGTATVFTQLLAAASRSIKGVVSNIDTDIIVPYIQMCYDDMLDENPDLSEQGDVTVVAKGVGHLQAKEQSAQRKVEFLQIAMTPVLSQVLGPKNLGALAAQVAKSNDIDLPDSERLLGEGDLGDQLQQLIMSSAGVDPEQMNGQMANGGGNVNQGQGMNPDGSKAGVVNG